MSASTKNYRLKFLVSSPVEKSDGTPRRFVGLEGISSAIGTLTDDDPPTKAALDSIIYRPGDVLFGKLRPYLAKSFMAESAGSGTSELLVLRPSKLIDSRFLLYLTLSSPWLEWADATSYGTKMPRTSWEAMSEYRIDLSPIDEQRRIARFLDAEMTVLNRVEQLRSEQLEQLTLSRWSVFQRALDQVPKIIIPLRRLLLSIVDGPFGSAFSSSDYTDDGAAVVRLGNIGFGEYRPEGQARIPVSLYKEFRKHEVLEGDLLIAGLGDSRNHAGRACTAPDLGPAIVKGKCYRARVDGKRASAEFLALLLSSPLGAAALEGRGSTRSMINLDIVKSALLPIPGQEDQEIITQEMRRYWQSALAAVQACNSQLTLLAERRRALITAAVTGQIDVTTARGGVE
jgi:type I restriction enzyme, S subunit